MFLSLGLILIVGYFAGRICQTLHLPALLGMLLAGMLLSRHALNLIDPNLDLVSADIRQIALIIILLRAGLDLNLNDLRQVGRPAFLMCFIPATCEIIGCALLGPALLGLSLNESLLLGSVLGAVSPAVVIPGMLGLMHKKLGTRKGIPQLILAGSSADDIYTLVLFTCFSSLVASGTFSAMTLLRIPTSILLGIGAGVAVGFFELWMFQKLGSNQTPLPAPAKIVIILGFSFLLIYLEKIMTGTIAFSGLLAIIASAMVIGAKSPETRKELSSSFTGIWQIAQIFLFVLVGASVDLGAMASAGLLYLAVILGALGFRMIGVYLSVSGSILNKKERFFCMLAYTPKATVQAAIGGVPLAMGLACGNTILTMAVLAILVTAPLGAIAIETGAPRLLEHNQS